MGRFSEEAVTMLAKIAAFTETHGPQRSFAAPRQFPQQHAEMTAGDRIASLVEHALGTVPCDAVLAPTRTGTTARLISRCKPPVWIVAPSSDAATCQGLAFSYGVYPLNLAEDGAISCSGRIFQAFRRAAGQDLGQLQTLGGLQWQQHAELIKQIEGGTLPLDRKMITPRSHSEAQQLERIHTK